MQPRKVWAGARQVASVTADAFQSIPANRGVLVSAWWHCESLLQWGRDFEMHIRLDGLNCSMSQVCTQSLERAVGRIAQLTGCGATHRPNAAIRQHFYDRVPSCGPKGHHAMTEMLDDTGVQ